MKQTTHYNLTKPELQDSPPDITVMNPNWDLIDTYLHEAYVNKLTAVDEIPAAPLPRDADRLGGFAASYFAPANLAQMKKLTDDAGLPLMVASDFNAMTETGIYQVNASTLNPIAGNSTGILQVFKRNATTFVFQQFQSSGDGFLYRYSSNNGVSWSSWKTAAFAENAIVETGSNANGDYVKFGDGTMICRRNMSSVEGIGSFALPAAFKDDAYSFSARPRGTASSTNTGFLVIEGFAENASSVRLKMLSVTASTITYLAGQSMMIIAIGAWK